MNEEKVRSCVHCGLCLEACPTYHLLGNEADSPRGRIFLMRGVLENRIPMTETVKFHLDRCLDCRACETVCPAGVPYGELISEARRDLYPRIRAGKPKDWLKKFLLSWILGKPENLRLLGKFLRLYQKSGLQAWIRKTKILRIFPSWLEKGEELLSFIPPNQTEPAAWTEEIPEQSSKGKVLVFRGCIASLFFPEVEQAAMKILKTVGYSPIPQKTPLCCGALHLHAGYWEEARELAGKNLLNFIESSCDFLAVTAAGCGATIKEYSHLLSGSPEVSRFSGKVRDISELIAPCLHEIKDKLKPLPLRVAYQDACHLLHAQKIRQEPRTLLQSIPELELLEIPDGELCCGSAGIYNLTHPEEAEKLLEEKMENIFAVNPDAVAVGNPGCLLQIRKGLKQAGSRIPAVHPLELLHASLS